MKLSRNIAAEQTDGRCFLPTAHNRSIVKIFVPDLQNFPALNCRFVEFVSFKFSVSQSFTTFLTQVWKIKPWKSFENGEVSLTIDIFECWTITQSPFAFYSFLTVDWSSRRNFCLRALRTFWQSNLRQK